MFATWQLLNFNFLNIFYHFLRKNAGPEHKTQVNDEADIREATKNQRLKINRHHHHQKKMMKRQTTVHSTLHRKDYKLSTLKQQ